MGSCRMWLNIMWRESAWLTSVQAVLPHNTGRYIIARAMITRGGILPFVVPALEECFTCSGLAMFQPGDKRRIERFGITRLALLAHCESMEDQLLVGIDLLGEYRQRFTGKGFGTNVDM